MPKIGPIKRRDLITYLKQLDSPARTLVSDMSS